VQGKRDTARRDRHALSDRGPRSATTARDCSPRRRHSRGACARRLDRADRRVRNPAREA